MNPPPTTPNETPVWLVILIPIIFFIVFPLFWCFVIWINSHVSGWQRLAMRYRSNETPNGKSWSGVQGQVGLVSYKSVLECAANETGLFIRPGLLFRFAHPQLFIPWSDFHNVAQTKMLWIPVVRADVGDPKIARIRIHEKVFTESEGRSLLEG